MKTIVCKVISNKMQNTVTVQTETLWEHPVYKKRLKRSTKYYAHTDKKVNEGAIVKIEEIKPVSKMVCWKVIEIVAK